MPVNGVFGSESWGADQRPTNFREAILYLMPNGKAPITALMARTAKESVNDPQFSWWDEPQNLLRLVKKGRVEAGENRILVDGDDPREDNLGTPWGSALHLTLGDLLMVEPKTDSETFAPEIMQVTGVLNKGEFTAARGKSGTTAAPIDPDQGLLKIGTAYPEGAPSPNAVSRNPIKYTNYTQIFKTAYEISGTARQTHARTGDELMNIRKRRMFDHSRDLEFATLFGTKSESVGFNGLPVRTTAGIRSFIPAQNTTVFDDPVTTDSFLEAVYKVFDFESPAGDTRTAFCGNEALIEMNKVIRDSPNSRMDLGKEISVYGMNFREFVLPQGRLMLKTHPLLNRHPLYQKSMWILDFSSLKYRFLKGRDTHHRENIQNRDEDSFKGMWLTECGLEVQRGGLTMGYLGNISAS